MLSGWGLRADLVEMHLPCVRVCTCVLTVTEFLGSVIYRRDGKLLGERRGKAMDLNQHRVFQWCL